MDFEMYGIVAIPVITVICFLVAEIIKATPLEDKWLPVCCGIMGAILGVIGMCVMPGFPADNILSAIAVGIVSGFAATGAHQVYKQLSKK